MRYLPANGTAGFALSFVNGYNLFPSPPAKILAQYPVLISNTTHFDEFRDEMYKVAGILYPKVIECILEDKVFDFADLFKGACSSGCGGCSGDCRNH